MASENSTTFTDQPVSEFLATLTERRQDEARQLIAMLGEISGEPAAMWGPSNLLDRLDKHTTSVACSTSTSSPTSISRCCAR